MAILKVTFTKTKRNILAQALWVLNWVSVITGLTLFSLGLFLKVEIQKRQEVMTNEIHMVPNMLIGVGLATCSINFLGGKICYDCMDTTAFLHWKLLMLPYIICTFFFTLYILVGALMCYAMRSDLEESLLLGLWDAMCYYKDTDIPGCCYIKHSIDLLQMQFQCCGNGGFRDWFHIQWVSHCYLDMSISNVVDQLQSNVEGKYLTDAVPFTCCNVHFPRPCIQHQITNSSAHYNYNYHGAELNLNQKGCRQALLQYYTQIMQFVGLIVLIMWLFELSVLTCMHFLQTSIENVLRLGDSESESDGWLLKNSISETVQHNFNIIKNLGKCYQVDDDPNIDVSSTSRQTQEAIKQRHP
uniref:Peripherin 2-like a n=1 Tax=Electrophorus electricus TaxID=8005 RepID=A0A4W4FL61_ELEEL